MIDQSDASMIPITDINYTLLCELRDTVFWWFASLFVFVFYHKIAI